MPPLLYFSTVCDVLVVAITSEQTMRASTRCCYAEQEDHREYVPPPFSHRLSETYLWTPHAQLDDAFCRIT